jgi:hypothetical protein
MPRIVLSRLSRNRESRAQRGGVAGGDAATPSESDARAGMEERAGATRPMDLGLADEWGEWCRNPELGLYVAPASNGREWHGLHFISSGAFAGAVFAFAITIPAGCADSRPALQLRCAHLPGSALGMQIPGRDAPLPIFHDGAASRGARPGAGPVGVRSGVVHRQAQADSRKQHRTYALASPIPSHPCPPSHGCRLCASW